MANVLAIHSVGYSLIGYLRQAYRNSSLRDQHPCAFRLISSGELADPTSIQTDSTATLTLYLYRVTMNEHRRNAPRSHDSARRPLPLSLNLHYLLTVWAESAMAEHNIVAWAMSQFAQEATFGRTQLSAEAGWQPDDLIQVIPEELTIESLMRIWDALEPTYRLSSGYIARVVRIDPDQEEEHRPVVVTDFRYEALDD